MYKGYIYRHWLGDKSYIGQTYVETPQQRWGKDGKGYHNQTKFGRAIKKYGWHNFGHEVLLAFECETKKELVFWSNQWEAYYIEKYDSFNNGYNSTTGGDNYIVCEETKQKMSERQDWRKRQVVCVNTGETFDSLIDAYEWVSGKKCNDGVTAISKCCRNFKSYETRFKHPSTGENIVWAWKKDYDKMTRNDIIKKLADAGVYGGATVVSLETVNENVTYKQDGIDIASLDYALRFLNANQLYIFKAVILQEKTLEEVAKEIGRSRQSVGRTCQEAIKKIQQRFTVAQFKEIITLN
jgi:hypothetical protein